MGMPQWLGGIGNRPRGLQAEILSEFSSVVLLPELVGLHESVVACADGLDGLDGADRLNPLRDVARGEDQRLQRDVLQGG